MALLYPISATQSGVGVAFPDAVHRVSFAHRDKTRKTCVIIVSVYANAGAAASGANPLFTTQIQPDRDDFDTYFGALPNEELALYPERAAYLFLKTVNPKAEGSKYPHFMFNYTTATDV